MSWSQQVEWRRSISLEAWLRSANLKFSRKLSFKVSRLLVSAACAPQHASKPTVCFGYCDAVEGSCFPRRCCPRAAACVKSQREIVLG